MRLWRHHNFNKRKMNGLDLMQAYARTHAPCYRIARKLKSQRERIDFLHENGEANKVNRVYSCANWLQFVFTTYTDDFFHREREIQFLRVNKGTNEKKPYTFTRAPCTFVDSVLAARFPRARSRTRVWVSCAAARKYFCIIAVYCWQFRPQQEMLRDSRLDDKPYRCLLVRLLLPHNGHITIDGIHFY